MAIESKVRPGQIEQHMFSLLRMRSSADLIPAEQSLIVVDSML